MPRLPISMPKMSMTMTEGTVVEWLVTVGSPVASGDVLAIVTTDKVDMEVESTASGVLDEILAGPGSVIAVGQPIGWLESESEGLLAGLLDAPAAGAEPATPPVTGSSVDVQDRSQSPEAGKPAGRVRAVPLARRLAAQAGLDLTTVSASGPSGTIRARDVRAAISARSFGEDAASRQARIAAASGPGHAEPIGDHGDLIGDARQRSVRQATARTMSASASVPQFTCFRVLDLSVLAHARQRGLRGVSWTAILLRAYAMLLHEHPNLNGQWTDAGIRANPQVRIALAVDTPVGLYAPVLLDPAADRLRELDARVRQLADQVRRGNPNPDLLGGATGTLSNLGGLGVDCFNALLTVPQATALSMGRVGPRPVCNPSGDLVGQVSCEVGLTLDHRVADGADGARALQFMQGLLADPVSLLA